MAGAPPTHQHGATVSKLVFKLMLTITMIKIRNLVKMTMMSTMQMTDDADDDDDDGDAAAEPAY